MARTFYEIDLLPSEPDQEFTISLNGRNYKIRIFYATYARLWWLHLSDLDNDVTLSQITLRPDVMQLFSGKISGYAGDAAIGMLRNRQGGEYASIDAFAGDFSLYFSDTDTAG
ncbi:hypothetical protein JY462_07885 [Serratia marcescens]|uniref:phage baseplate plug family protein n=1 Tax=Serratia marcescens TaxID=615 RepID=UPI000B5F5440|nr:hypothetical protein [Serratia marcescens]ASM07252.1 hypothetical protein BVG91_09535 [Serratia marcescens]MBN5204734.1 hypothetical protein [Serratia marcescens]